jgi:hypothetical protein
MQQHVDISSNPINVGDLKHIAAFLSAETLSGSPGIRAQTGGGRAMWDTASSVRTGRRAVRTAFLAVRDTRKDIRQMAHLDTAIQLR